MHYDQKLFEHMEEEHGLLLTTKQLRKIIRTVLDMDDSIQGILHYYPLFEHIDKEHDLILLESQLVDIVRIVSKIYNENPEKCTMNPQQNPHDSRTVSKQEKGNQLDQVYGLNKTALPIADSIADSLGSVKKWPICGRFVAD